MIALLLMLRVVMEMTPIFSRTGSKWQSVWFRYTKEAIEHTKEK